MRSLPPSVKNMYKSTFPLILFIYKLSQFISGLSKKPIVGNSWKCKSSETEMDFETLMHKTLKGRAVKTLTIAHHNVLH